MQAITTYTLRDLDLETLLREGAAAPIILGKGAYRGPAAVFSCNHHRHVWRPNRRGYTDPSTRERLEGKFAHLDQVVKTVLSHRRKGGRFTVRPSGVYIPRQDSYELEQIVQFTITITSRAAETRARRTGARPIPARRKPDTTKRNRHELFPPRDWTTPVPRACPFCFSSDIDPSGCRTCKRGNGGYGLKW